MDIPDLRFLSFEVQYCPISQKISFPEWRGFSLFYHKEWKQSLLPLICIRTATANLQFFCAILNPFHFSVVDTVVPHLEPRFRTMALTPPADGSVGCWRLKAASFSESCTQLRARRPGSPASFWPLKGLPSPAFPWDRSDIAKGNTWVFFYSNGCLLHRVLYVIISILSNLRTNSDKDYGFSVKDRIIFTCTHFGDA